MSRYDRVAISKEHKRALDRHVEMKGTNRKAVVESFIETLPTWNGDSNHSPPYSDVDSDVVKAVRKALDTVERHMNESQQQGQ